VPPKIRVFWWQVSHDFILCRANLQRQHIEPVGTYIFCGMEDESTYHALAQCSFTISFRERLKRLTRIQLPKLWPWSWTRDLLEDSFCKEERGIILCGMWSLWNRRNERKDGKTTIDPGSAIEWALEACFQLATAP